MILAVLLLRDVVEEDPPESPVVALATATSTLTTHAVPTWTPTNPPPPTATFTPSSMPTLWPAPSYYALVNANLRWGPGTNYAIGGGVKVDDPLQVQARTSDSQWLELDNGL